MNANRMAQASLVLSVITLALVVMIATRPAPAFVDNSGSIRFAVADVAAQVADLRTLLEAQPGSSPDSQLASISERLDRLEASVTSVGAKIQAICSAIQSSPFAPSGFACP